MTKTTYIDSFLFIQVQFIKVVIKAKFIYKITKFLQVIINYCVFHRLNMLFYDKKVDLLIF
jgi:hypothetical protein